MSGCGIKNTVTIVTHRHRSFGGVQGDLFKGQPCWGGNRSCRGNAPLSVALCCAQSPPRRAQTASFDGHRLSKVLLRYSWQE